MSAIISSAETIYNQRRFTVFASETLFPIQDWAVFKVDLAIEMTHSISIRTAFHILGVRLNPYTLAIDREDRLLVVETAGRVVQVFALERRTCKRFSDLGEDRSSRMLVAPPIVGENIYVVDSVMDKTCVFVFSA